LVEEFKKIAVKLGCTPAQLSVAWVMSQGDDIFPIPGTKRVDNLEELLGAVNVKIPGEDQKAIKKLLQGISGERYNANRMVIIQRDKK